MGWVMEYLPPPKHAVEDRYKPDPDKIRAPTVGELDKVEQQMVALARAAESLILKSSLLHDLDLAELEASHPEGAVRKLAAKPRVHLAQKIIRGFWDNREDMRAYQDLLRTRFPTLNAANLAKVQETSGSTQGDWPPPLPQISDKVLENRVFTHSSVFKLQSHVFKLESTMRNNERLEFLGDSVLERVVCDMLFAHFPHDSEGSLTTKKTQMVRNVKLDEFAMLYRLDKLLRFHTQETAELNSNLKIYADLFEAYIGGVYEDQGYETCEKWLQKLYAPMIAKFKVGSGAPRGAGGAAAPKEAAEAKSKLYRKIGSATRKIIYTPENNTSPFTVACHIDGVFLGRGTAGTKKEAGNLAALEALSKTQLIEEQANIRAAVPRTAKVTSGMESE